MNQQEIDTLHRIRDQLRGALAASVTPCPQVTDHENLEDIFLKLQRTMNTVEHALHHSEIR